MVEELPPQHQVFINFRGADLRHGFVSHLVTAFKNHHINVFVDDYEDRGESLAKLLTRIEESKIALAIFSGKYTESMWCLSELAKIKKCMDQGKLVAIPIFFKLEPYTVKGLRGDFGDSFRDLSNGDMRKEEWRIALEAIPQIMGITVHDYSKENEKINEIVNAVKKALSKIPLEGSQVCLDPSENNKNVTSSSKEKYKTFGLNQSLKELGDKLDPKLKETRIIGVVGMPGIGKTTLLKELFKIWHPRFNRRALIDQIHELDLDCLPALLMEELLGLKDAYTDNVEDPYENYKVELLERQVLVILDDVSQKEQIDALLGRRDWISKGSRIVIATNDMSLLKGLADDTYVVRQLNHKDSLQLFHHHAFTDDQANPPKEDFMKLSEEFVYYARGHPLALKILGSELHEKNIKHWKDKLVVLAQKPSSSSNIGSIFQVSYDKLTLEQQEAFLDIACFRLQDKDYVESLLASSDPGSEAMSVVSALANKFLINTCDGRVEMHDLLYKFSKEVDSKASIGSKQRRLCLHQDIIKGGDVSVLQNNMRPANIRGIFLDLSEVMGETSLDKDIFKRMSKLRYLKLYNSHCPKECKTNNKINIRDGLNLPLKEVRCLHWLKFPLEELPNDFNPINLLDLKLPFSEIERLWDDAKDAPVLKWVDLNHSSKLSTLSGLTKAQNLESLNLEGCTSLESLGDTNLMSLKTLTLSNCSNFKEISSIPENLEILYLDGTAISRLPDDMVSLDRLIFLNMKDCKLLENIPTNVGKLKALQKLVLSGCSKLKHFPEINKSSLKILLLDGTSIKTIPQLPSVQYLCLSRNDQISCLPVGIIQLCQLKWLDLKYCKSLTSIPELPPNLQYLDAHGCSSLKTVAKPLARILPAGQNHCTFIFTYCHNLEQAASEEIMSYARRKCQLLSDVLKHYNESLTSEPLFSTSFPGCEVPSWLYHKSEGSMFQPKLLPHWHGKGLSGIALCAVISSFNDQDGYNSVNCTFKIKVADKTWLPFTCQVGSWTRDVNKKEKMDSDHVFISYISCPHTIRCLEDENFDKCNFTEASIEFAVTGSTSETGKVKVLRCGLSLMYAEDKNKNSSHEAKYDMPIQVKRKKGVMDEQRRSKKIKGLVISNVTQTCGSSVTEKMEDNFDCQSNGS